MIAVPILRSLAPWGLALTLILAVVVIDPEPARAHAAPPTEPMTPLDAWDAVRPMGLGIKIGNTLDNTTTWETGCGNPPITKQYVQARWPRTAFAPCACPWPGTRTRRMAASTPPSPRAWARSSTGSPVRA